MSRVMAVTNQKGGVGKTTTAVNLSAYVSLTGRKVLLVDADPQGNASSGLGFSRGRDHISLYDVVTDNLPAREAIVPTELPRLDLLPSTIDLAGAEIELARAEQREYFLRQALSAVAADYDYIFIDCPPSLGLLTLNALVAADAVLIPMQCEYYALEGLSSLNDTIQLIQRQLNPALRLSGIIFTLFDSRTNLGSQVMEDVRSHFPREAYDVVIPRNVRLGEAPSYGQPIALYDPKSKGAEAYEALAGEVMAREEEI